MSLKETPSNPAPSLEDEALYHLTTVLNDALADLSVNVAVIPQRWGVEKPVALSSQVPGYVRGISLEAAVWVTVSGNNPEQLTQRVTQVYQVLLGSSRVELRTNGILQLTPQTPSSIAPIIQKSKTTLEQQITFQLLAEFLKEPTASEDTIKTISASANFSVDNSGTTKSLFWKFPL